MNLRPLTMSPLDWLMLVVLSILWGGSFILNKIAVAALPPMTVALGRTSIAALILVAIAATRRELRVLFAAWPVFLTLGLFNSAVPFSLIAWSQTHIGSGLASILNATTPMFAVVFAHIATRDDKLTLNRTIGLVIGMIGVAVMIGLGALTGLGGHVAGELACLVAAALYAGSTVFARGYRSFAPTSLGAGQTASATLLLFPVVAVVDPPWTRPLPSATALVAVVLLGALSTAIAYLLFFRILERAGATNVSLVTFLIPVSAILLSVLLLGERLELHQIAGMAAIAAGLVAIDGRAGQFMRHWRSPGVQEPDANS
ncbi:MAG: DMT family transporter [Xanthobacteraceae bacterium]